METLDLNNKLDQMDEIGVHRVFHPKNAEYTFFSSAQGTFFRINNMLGAPKQVSVNSSL